MAIEERHVLTWEEARFYRVLRHRLLMGMMYWKDDLTIPANRADLPGDWLGKQVLSRQQRLMACDVSRKKVYRTARKVFKSGWMEVSILQTCLLYNGGGVREGMFLTPGDAQMKPWMERLRNRIDKTPLFSMMRDRFSVGDGIITWRNGYKLYMRIAGQSGTGQNVISLRVSNLWVDEWDYLPWPVWIECKQSMLPDATVEGGGVPRGIRDMNPFYTIVYDPVESRGWSIHAETTGNVTSYISPLYASQEAKLELINMYGGENTDGYVTQVLALDSDSVSSSFPVIPAKADLPYAIAEVTDDMLNTSPDWAEHFNIPHLPPGVTAVALGIDPGYSPDPAVLGASYLLDGVWYDLFRVNMQRCTEPLQRRVIRWHVDHMPLVPLVISVDSNAQGLGLFQELREEYPLDRMTIIPGNFNTKTEVDLWLHTNCDTPLEAGDYCPKCDRYVPERERKLARVWQKQYLTNVMKAAFHNGHNWLERSGPFEDGQMPPNTMILVVAFDRKMQDELSGTTETKTKSGDVTYRFPASTGDHVTDMYRMKVNAIQYYNAHDQGQYVYTGNVVSGGWATNPMLPAGPGRMESGWTPPWSR